MPPNHGQRSAFMTYSLSVVSKIVGSPDHLVQYHPGPRGRGLPLIPGRTRKPEFHSPTRQKQRQLRQPVHLQPLHEIGSFFAFSALNYTRRAPQTFREARFLACFDRTLLYKAVPPSRHTLWATRPLGDF